MMNKGIVFDIKKFAIHDGPGIRTSIFMKGCPLRCIWCHNPEGIDRHITSYKSHRKLGELTFDREEQVGKEYTTEELLKEILKDKPFYDESEGGVTFSGGEPMAQPQFLLEMMDLCHQNGVTIAIDTSGFAMADVVERVFSKADLIMLDLKHPDPKIHKEVTDRDLKVVLESLEIAAKSGKRLWIRIPIIPGINHDVALAKGFIEILKPYVSAIEQINLLPFHATADHKYKRMNRDNKMLNIPSLNYCDLEPMAEAMSQLGVKVIIGG